MAGEIPELERLKTSVSGTVANLERLEQEKLALLDPTPRNLEELRYRVRVEARYVRVLRRASTTSRDEIGKAQRELAQLKTSHEDLKGTLTTLFARIDAAGRAIDDLLARLQEKLVEETRLLGTAEGRSLFSQHVDLAAYRSFLEAWQAEQDIAQALVALQDRINEVRRSMDAAQGAMVTPLVSAAAYGVLVIGLFSLGFALLGVLAAIAAVGSLAGLAGKKDLLERLLRRL